MLYTLPRYSTPAGLYAVADGMGGQRAGEVASQMPSIRCVTIWERYLDLRLAAHRRRGRMLSPHGSTRILPSRTAASDLSMVDVLTATMQRCNQRIRDNGQQFPENAGLGSTLTVAMVTGDLALIGNIGDSRTYMVRDGSIRSLTQDHSLVGSLVRQGLISEDDVYRHPHRNLIYNALGTRADAKPDVVMQRLQAGDILVLCSDGLWEMVRDEDIRAAVESLTDPAQAAQLLVDAANANGGVDNISVVVVRVQ